VLDEVAIFQSLFPAVDPAFTSQTCHACGHLESRSSQAAFRCTNEECWVTEYQADINAAANIASRLNPREESLPWKSAGDDSPQDGSTLDSAPAHRDPSAKPERTTVTEWGWKPLR
jgi:transposase